MVAVSVVIVYLLYKILWMDGCIYTDRWINVDGWMDFRWVGGFYGWFGWRWARPSLVEGVEGRAWRCTRRDVQTSFGDLGALGMSTNPTHSMG